MLVDHQIRRYVEKNAMIDPFSERVDGKEKASFGLQPAGYDARLDPNILVLYDVAAAGKILDPLNIDTSILTPMIANPYYDVPPHTFVIITTIEKFRIPATIAARGVGKTLYALCGVILIVSSISPGWRGHLRIHLTNTSAVPVRIYGNQGIVHLIFEELPGIPEHTYDQLSSTRF